MIPDFPYNVRIRLAKLNFFLLHQDVAKSQSQFRFFKLRQPIGQRLSNVRTQQTQISIVPILFLYYEESLVSSNLNYKQLRFHGAHPTTHISKFDFLVNISLHILLILFSKFSKPCVYSFWQILQILHLFPALRLFRTLE